MHGILVVDDHPAMREGISTLLTREPGLEVLGFADDAADALRSIDTLRPGVVVTDLVLPGRSGLDLIKDIRYRWVGLPVVVYTMRGEPFVALRALRAGARAYVSKCSAGQELVTAVRKVLRGEAYVSSDLASQVLGTFVGERGARPQTEQLSDREFEVFELIGRGLSLREIAERLKISPKTVDSHRENIKAKLGTVDSNELRKQAIAWVSLEQPH